MWPAPWWPSETASPGSSKETRSSDRDGARSPSTPSPRRRTSLSSRSNLTAEEAAAVPMAGLTALQALRDAAKVEQGQKVLVTGASGGVGSFTVQIAKAMGAEVTAICSTRNVDRVRSIGADHVIDYTQEDFTKNGSHVRRDCRQRRQQITAGYGACDVTKGNVDTKQRAIGQALGGEPPSAVQDAGMVAVRRPEGAHGVSTREPGGS